MLLRRLFHHVFAPALIAASCLAPAFAATEISRTQLLFVGASPGADLPAKLPVISIADLPEAGKAKQEVFAARLRSSPVSTFVSQPSPENGHFEQFFLVTDVALETSANGYQIALGQTTYDLTEFAARMSAAVDAFNPKHRRIGFMRLTDTADTFPMAMSDIQGALDSLGFDMLVVMIGAQASGAGCSDAPAQAIHYSLISGLADRVPFGDGDGVSTSAEVEEYLTRALNRMSERDPVCGPKYSLILKSSNDPAHPLATHAGKSAFVDMETRLYNETFEAKFLMGSKDLDNVQAFLESCLYCPNEAALLERLNEMEENARTAKLESEIWNRIKDDPGRDRLAIYLKNCTLCAYRDAAESRIADIDARAAAFQREEEEFAAASETRDLDALRSYFAGCIACTHVEAAGRMVAEIEADTVYQVERAKLDDALGGRSIDLLQAYLDECKICDGRDEVAAAMVIEKKRQEFHAPCLALAGVPQLGGPRKLEAIDQDKARGVCETAAMEFPEDGLIRTTLGRIAQAAGDFETAQASYVFGMEDDVPSAYGLAAYSFYAPPDGGRIDLDKVEELAAIGAEKNDWLSKEILTVIYSKDLVPGKTPKDAFDIAQAIADEGNALAQFFVGYYFLTGTGVDPDEDQAVAWLTKSVEQGYTHSYSFLAELIEQGRGTEQLPDRAADLYWTALEDGDPTATDRLTTQLGNRDREVVRIIQQKLRDQGVYRGAVDGIAGPSTVAAIRRYAASLTEAG